MDGNVIAAVQEPAPAARVASSERWGWRFRDLSSAAPVPCGVPRPGPTLAALPTDGRAQGPRAVFIVAAILAVLSLCIGPFVVAGLGLVVFPGVSLLVLWTLGVLLAGAALHGGVSRQRQANRRWLAGILEARRQWVANEDANWRRYLLRLQEWQEQKDQYERDYIRWLNALPQWGVLRPRQTAGRVDVFGGTPQGWEALTFTLGTSILEAGADLAILDLTQNEATGPPLRGYVQERGLSNQIVSLPRDAAQFDFLLDMSPQEIPDFLVEALHGEDKETAIKDRTPDKRILAGICQSIAKPWTIHRIWAGLQVLLHQTNVADEDGVVFIDDEKGALLNLFADDHRQRLLDRIVAIDGMLHDIRKAGLDSAPPGAGAPDLRLRVSELTASGSILNKDFFVHLLVQSTIQRLSSRPPGGRLRPQALLLLGADDLRTKDLERLDDLSTRHGVRLILCFRHLRRTAQELLGGGTAATVFMRLGNDKEAATAAEYIGREYKFVLSGLSATEGKNYVYTGGKTKEVSVGRAINATFGQLPSRTRSQNVSFGESFSEAWGVSHDEGQQLSRVYEFAVEPTVLQVLPATGLLLVEPAPDLGGKLVQSGNCDPRLVELPAGLVSLDPLPAWWEKEGGQLARLRK